MLCHVRLKSFSDRDKLKAMLESSIAKPQPSLSTSWSGFFSRQAGLLPEEEGSDPKLTELSPFPPELVRHEVPVEAAADGCGLDL